jgi:hypothetical protein
MNNIIDVALIFVETLNVMSVTLHIIQSYSSNRIKGHL